jgi:hypothetical protein
MNNQEHLDVARKIAGEGIVLLKMKLCFSQLMQTKK